MKKILFAFIGSSLAFGLGLAGVYFSLPLLAPDQATVAADSLQATDSLQIAASQRVGLDSLATPDSSAVLTRMVPEAAVDSAGALRDSLEQMHEAVDGLERDKAALMAHLEEIQRELEALTRQRVEAKDLSATITKLEEKDLATLVGQLDPYVLKLLYEEASGRNRSRLLQALPADYAARLVQQLIDPSPIRNVEVPVEPDTLDASQADLSETVTPNRLP